MKVSQFCMNCVAFGRRVIPNKWMKIKTSLNRFAFIIIRVSVHPDLCDKSCTIFNLRKIHEWEKLGQDNTGKLKNGCINLQTKHQWNWYCEERGTTDFCWFSFTNFANSLSYDSLSLSICVCICVPELNEKKNKTKENQPVWNGWTWTTNTLEMQDSILFPSNQISWY